MKGGITMLDFFVGYFDPAGVPMQRTYQVNAGREQYRQAAEQIIKCLTAEGCRPSLIARLPGNYTLKELELLCENGLPQSLMPLHGTYEYFSIDNQNISK